MATKPNRTIAWASLLVAVVAAAVYANSLGNGFTFDDHKLIVDNPRIQEEGRLGELFSQPFFGGDAETALGLYRPATAFSFWIDARSGEGTSPFHRTNLLLHAACAVLLLLLACRLTTAGPALFASLLFAVHPIATDAVNPIAGRTDLLASAFVLAALLASVRLEGRRRLLPALVFLLTLLGCLAKEIGVVVLPLLLVVDYLRGFPWSRRIAVYVASAGGILIYIVMRVAVQGTLLSPNPIRWIDNPLTAEDLLTRALTALAVLGRYVVLLFYPARLSPDYAYDSIPVVRTLLDPWSLLGIGVILLLAWIAWLTFRSDSQRWALLGVGLIVFPLVPVSSFPLPLANLMAERYLYLPSAGFALLLALAAHRFSGDRSRIVLLVATTVLVAGATRTVVRNRDWVDDLTLFTQAERVVPRNVKVLSNLAYEHAKLGELDKAESLLRRAVEIRPEFAENQVNLGNVLAQKGRFEEAAAAYEYAIETGPPDPLAHANLARALQRLGRYERAIAEFEESLRLDPDYHKARLDLANLLREAGVKAPPAPGD